MSMEASILHRLIEAHGKKDIDKEFNTLGLHFAQNAGTVQNIV